MEEVFTNIYEFIINLINNSNALGPVIACLLIFVESILPVLPLFVFITIIFIAYGYVAGFIIAYLLTSLGCFVSFYICRKFLKNFFTKRVRKIKEFDSIMKRIDKISFSNLVFFIAVPYTPAFLVNIAAALSEMNFKKFATAILISKPFIVFFWGFIGTSLIESLKNPKIMLMILAVFLLSKVVARKLKMD